MKTITIGRDASCNIILNDSMISRQHALLRISSSGKMHLIDMSSNGTYVNGIRITKNKPIPVKRKDVISFAHVQELDWKEVPNPLKWVKWGLLVLGVIIAAIFVCLIINSCYERIDDSFIEIQNNETLTDNDEIEVDSISPKHTESKKMKISKKDVNSKDTEKTEDHKNEAKWYDKYKSPAPVKKTMSTNKKQNEQSKKVTTKSNVNSAENANKEVKKTILY